MTSDRKSVSMQSVASFFVWKAHSFDLEIKLEQLVGMLELITKSERYVFEDAWNPPVDLSWLGIQSDKSEISFRVTSTNYASIWNGYREVEEDFDCLSLCNEIFESRKSWLQDKFKLILRPTLSCNYCQSVINDPDTSIVFWNLRGTGKRMIALCHRECETLQAKNYYPFFCSIAHFVDSQLKFRRYFNAAIIEQTIARADVRTGLEQVFAIVPDEYFDFYEADYVDYLEQKEQGDQTSTGDHQMRCPKCGTLGSNYEVPEMDYESNTLTIPVECQNCGNHWRAKKSGGS